MHHAYSGEPMIDNSYLGQITMAGYAFAPKGYALCNGQLMPLAQNQALFSLLGVQFGGNGVTNFALPNMQGRTPVGQNMSNYPIGSLAGVENVTLLGNQLPAHLHSVAATNVQGKATTPSGGLFATSKTNESLYGPMSQPVALASATCDMAGGNQPHPNMQPFRTINFTIALQGIFPSRS